MGLRLSTQQVVLLLRYFFDTDGDGNVSYPEFCTQLWQQKFIRVRSKLHAASYRLAGMDWTALFRHYDRDSSGGL